MDRFVLEGWKLLSALIAAGGGGGFVIFLALKSFSGKWLDAKFSERLVKLKHEQSKEIEGLRQLVQWEFSRISKIHEKEFEVLPRAWRLLHEASGYAGHLTTVLNYYPEFEKLSEEVCEKVVAESRLPDHKKKG